MKWYSKKKKKKTRNVSKDNLLQRKAAKIRHLYETFSFQDGFEIKPGSLVFFPCSSDGRRKARKIEKAWLEVASQHEPLYLDGL